MWKEKKSRVDRRKWMRKWGEKGGGGEEGRDS